MPGPYLNSGIFQTRITDNDVVGPKEELGVWRYEAGKILKYVKSGALIPKLEGVRIDFTVTTAALMGNQVLSIDAPTSMLVGVAETTFASLSFGWVTVYGPATARVNPAAAAGNTLVPSTATGVLAPAVITGMAPALSLAAGLSGGSAVFVRGG